MNSIFSSLFPAQISIINFDEVKTQFFIYFFAIGVIFCLIPMLMIISKKFHIGNSKPKDITYRRIVYFVGLALLVFIVASPIGGIFNSLSYEFINKIAPQDKMALAPQIIATFSTCIVLSVVGYVVFSLLCSFISTKMLKKYKINSVFVSNNKILGLF